MKKNMTKGILCTIDFSPSSKEVLKWSVKLAKKLGSHLTILHAYRLFKLNGETVAFKRKMEEEAATNFKVLETELLKNSKISYDFKTEVGFVDDRIEEHLKTNPISFLVMGKDMTIKNREAFDELMDHLKIPLVIVPETPN